jgi:hypothetical protein
MTAHQPYDSGTRIMCRTCSQVWPSDRAYRDDSETCALEERVDRKTFSERLGILPDSLSAYVSRSQRPKPNGHDHHGHPWWWESVVRDEVDRPKRTTRGS